MRRWVPMAGALLLAFAAIAIATLLYRGANSRERHAVMYRGKPLSVWFYGSRTDFFSGTTRTKAREALIGAGTNAMPFLLATLARPQGSPTAYWRAYQIMPGWLQARTPYPILSDDIRAVALSHLWEMRDRLSKQEFQALADYVPNLRNARLRLSAFNVASEKCEGTPPFRALCRKLLDDPDPALRLEGAIHLAESALSANPAEPRLALILLPAFERKELRQHCTEINGYSYRQWPPGRPPKGVALYRLPGYVSADQGESLKARIRIALIRLEPYLTPEQKVRFKELDGIARDAKSSLQ